MWFTFSNAIKLYININGTRYHSIRLDPFLAGGHSFLSVLVPTSSVHHPTLLVLPQENSHTSSYLDLTGIQFHPHYVSVVFYSFQG
jgi:hypothetical protein